MQQVDCSWNAGGLRIGSYGENGLRVYVIGIPFTNFGIRLKS